MPQIYGKVNEALPAANSESTNAIVRLNKYGEIMNVPIGAGLYGIADEGSYFSAMTATPGTGYTLSGATQTAWVATTPTLFLKNGASSGGKRVFLDSVRFSITTAPTAAASVHFAVVLDRGARTTSAGTALSAAQVNGASSTATITTGIVAGAVTAGAATTPIYLYRGTLKNSIPVIGDSYIINFASLDSAASANGAGCCGPVILDGGQSVLVYLWFPSQSAAGSGEVQASWWER